MIPFTKWSAMLNIVLLKATFQSGKQSNKLKIERDWKGIVCSWGVQLVHWVGNRPGSSFSHLQWWLHSICFIVIL